MPNPNKKIGKALPAARQMALRTLLSMQARQDKLQSCLNTVLAAAPKTTDPKDKALATELVYGCVRLEIRLDWILDQYLTKPDALPLAMRRVLRMAAYELLYLSHIPPYATLSLYVDAIKSGYGPKMAGLANAVLRNISRAQTWDKAFFEQQIPDSKTFMQIWHSMPAWLVEHFLNSYPRDQALAYMNASLEIPALGLRLNMQKEDWQQLAEQLEQTEGFIKRAAAAVAFETGFMPENLGLLLAKGQVSRQSFAAQEAMSVIFEKLDAEVKKALALGPVWDICAGQGGKTAWLIEKGLPVAICSDTNFKRLQNLKQELTRLGLPVPVVVVANAANLPFNAQTGIIIADAPCSGLGTLARRPDIKASRCPEDISALIKLQKQIAQKSFTHLAPGGLLIYLTCTLNPDENQKVIDKLLKKEPAAKQLFTWSTPIETFAKEFFWAAVVQKQS